MGNYTGKVLLPNGSIHEFSHPLTVAELMMEHSQQAVIEYQSLLGGRRVTPLPADKKLEMKKVYLMIPMKKCLSGDEARRVLENANNVLRSRVLASATGLLPILIRGCQNSVGVERKIVRQKRTEIMNKVEVLPEEFLSRQFSGKGWKPSLDTITEKMIDKKVSHWLY